MTSEEFTIFRGASFASTMVRRVRCLLGSPTLPRPSLFILVIISIAQSTLGDCERCCKEEDYGNATDTCFYASQLSRVPALHSCCGIDPAKRSWCCPLFTVPLPSPPLSSSCTSPAMNLEPSTHITRMLPRPVSPRDSQPLKSEA